MDSQTDNKLPALFAPGPFAAWLALAVVASFPDVVFGFGSFVLRDFASFGYPLAVYHKTSFWQGELPMWNPLVYCGVPHLAQWNTLALYPGSLIYLLLPLPISLSWFCLLHLYLGGLGMYFLVRHWAGKDFPAALAGVVFAFSGLLQHCLMWPNNIAALGLMPWTVLAVMHGCRHGRRALLGAIVVGTVQMLSGAPEMILVTWLLAVAAVVIRAFAEGDRRGVVRRGLRFVGIVLGVAGLAAIQLLPFFDLAKHSLRISHGHETLWSAQPAFWTNMFLPMAGADYFQNGVVFLIGQDWINSIYSGLPVVWLALVAVGSRRSLPVRAATLAVLGAMILATGPAGYVFSWANRVVPLEAIRFPVKFLVPVFFLLPLLAAKGAGMLLPSGTRSDDPLSRAAVISLGVILALFALSTLMIGTATVGEDPMRSLMNGLARLLWLGVAVVLVALLRRGANSRTAGWLQVGLVAIVWWDLRTHLPALAPRVPPRVFQVENELVASLHPKPVPATGRLFRLPDTYWRTDAFNDTGRDMALLLARAEMQPNLNVPEGMAAVTGFLSLWFPMFDGVRSILTDRNERLNEEFADFLAVSHVNSREEIGSWIPRPRAHGWVTAGMAPRFLGTRETFQRIANGWWDAEAEVFLGQQWRNEIQAEADEEAVVRNVEFGNERVRFEVECAKPTTAAIAQFYHRWWKATVDGRATPVMPANLGFQALVVPAGRHVVELRYVDRWFQLGAGITALSLALCATLWWFWRPKAEGGGDRQA